MQSVPGPLLRRIDNPNDGAGANKNAEVRERSERGIRSYV